MAESGLIVEYLTEHFGGKDKGLIPKKWKEGKEGQIAGEADEWLRYRYFMHYAEGSLMSLLVLALVMSRESISFTYRGFPRPHCLLIRFEQS